MTMASFLRGKPIMEDYTPASSYNAGDVLVIGNLPCVAHEANPPFAETGGIFGTTIKDAVAVGGGIYKMTGDASYAPGSYVHWNASLAQVTGTPSSATVPFGIVVGGGSDNLVDSAGMTLSVFHWPFGNPSNGSLPLAPFAAALTAHSGGTQAAALALTASVNEVTTVAAQGDSVKLPASVAGLEITVINHGANAMQVFGAGTDTINGIATATGISMPVGAVATFCCVVAGNWDVEIPLSTQPGLVTLGGAANAIPPHVAHTYVVTTAGVNAMTLAAPTATTDDGLIITVTSNTAFAHTLTATGLLQCGTAAVNVATFAAQKGAGLTLMAYQGKWNVLASVGITFS